MAPTLYRFRGRFRSRASRTRRGGGGDWENEKSILKGIQVAGPRVEEKIPSIYCGNRGKFVTVFWASKSFSAENFLGVQVAVFGGRLTGVNRVRTLCAKMKNLSYENTREKNRFLSPFFFNSFRPSSFSNFARNFLRSKKR